MRTEAAASGLEYIRGYYKVPAHLGGQLVFDETSGTIVGSSGPHLLVLLDGRADPVPVHPTWRVTYV